MDRKSLTCIICPTSCQITVDLDDNGSILEVEGHRCKRGDLYVRDEVIDPCRVLATIIRLKGGRQRMCPVRTDKAVSKNILIEMAKAVSKIEVEAPVRVGDVVISNMMGTGANIVVTQDIN